MNTVSKKKLGHEKSNQDVFDEINLFNYKVYIIHVSKIRTQIS